MPPKGDPNYHRDDDTGSEKGRGRAANKPFKKPHNPRHHSKPRSVHFSPAISVESLSSDMSDPNLHGGGAGGGGRPEARYQANDLASGGISADKVQEILECPVCLDVPKAPIYNCETGHTVCGNCRQRVANCPLCRKGFTNVRNFIAEKLAETLEFPCPFLQQGCEARIKPAEEVEHVKICNYRPVGCEVFPCSGSHIDFGRYLDHLKKDHRAGSSSGTQTKVRREVYVKKPQRLMEQGHRVPYMMSCFGNTFLQYCQAVGGKMWFWVSIFGTPEEAKRYRVTISLVSRNQDLRSSWTGPVHSVRHSGDDIYLNGLCMVTTEECLKAFFYRHPDKFSAYSMEIEIEKVR